MLRLSRFALPMLLTFLVAAPASAGEWKSLFDGKSLEGWKNYQSDTPIGDAWVVEDGTLHLSAGGAGDIVTEATYSDFEFEFEWKISPGGNSGILYLVRPGDKKPFHSGPEYQLLDDSKHKDGGNPKTSTGALYAMIAPAGKMLNPVGEWNTGKIVVHNNRIEHWLNGKKVVETTRGSDQWNELVSNSKFNKWEQFGKSDTGHLCLQDHGNKVWFRNLRIRELNDPPSSSTEN